MDNRELQIGGYYLIGGEVCELLDIHAKYYSFLILAAKNSSVDCEWSVPIHSRLISIKRITVEDFPLYSHLRTSSHFCQILKEATANGSP